MDADTRRKQNMKIGIIGAGFIGKTLARNLAAAGHDVKVANSRGPETIEAEALSTGARAVTTAETVEGVDVVILSIPLFKLPRLKPLISALPSETVVIDTSNYYPGRDNRIEALEQGQVESEWVQEQIGHPIAKAWNMILSESFAEKNHPAGHPDRLAIAVAADSERERNIAAELVEATGFDAYHAGSIRESWRFQPGAPGYCTELKLGALPAALAATERARLPARRDFAMAIIGERLSDGKSVLEPGYIARLNRLLYT
ncbi:NADPH-dependent F420 reductase [Melittangium boletus]|uniref:NADPH-dependent F420 reductase n=1 Tax=Melittangium boletus TaxID=83453 RepID=UPI003DA21738